MIQTSCFLIAQRFVGLKKIHDKVANPQIVAMLQLEDPGITQDEVPWCSAFANYVAWLLRLPRSKSLAARSWLQVGSVVSIHDAIVGNDAVILKRGPEPQPGPDVIDAPGHVGFFAGAGPLGANGWPSSVYLLGGNQNNSVCVEPFQTSAILGVRRLNS
jgi:uncharacterized protein (TIGR02594 family)